MLNTHGIGWTREIDNVGLDLGHRFNRITDSLGADTRIFKSLKRKVVGSSRRWSVDLHSTGTHVISDRNRLGYIAGKDATL